MADTDVEKNDIDVKAVVDSPKVDDDTEDAEGGKDKDDADVEADEETQNALNLYRALNGPNGRLLIEQLAEKARGVAQDAGKSPSEAKSEIISILKEELGEEYKFLAERIAKGLDKVLTNQSKALEAKLAEREAKRAEAEADQALDEFYRLHKAEIPQIEKKMLKLMKSMPIGEGITYKEYLGNLYTVATGKKSDLDEERVRENLKEPRVNGGSSGVSEIRVKRGPERPSIDEALAAAAAGIQFK